MRRKRTTARELALRAERAAEVAKLRKWDPDAARRARSAPLPAFRDPAQIDMMDGIQVDIFEAAELR